MQITRNAVETTAGPSEWFTGSVTWGDHVTDEEYSARAATRPVIPAWPMSSPCTRGLTDNISEK